MIHFETVNPQTMRGSFNRCAVLFPPQATPMITLRLACLQHGSFCEGDAASTADAMGSMPPLFSTTHTFQSSLNVMDMSPFVSMTWPLNSFATSVQIPAISTVGPWLKAVSKNQLRTIVAHGVGATAPEPKWLRSACINGGTLGTVSDVVFTHMC